MSFRNRFSAFLVIVSTFAHVRKSPGRAFHTAFRASYHAVQEIRACCVDQRGTLFLLKHHTATADSADEKVCKNEQKALILQGLVCILAAIIGRQATERNR